MSQLVQRDLRVKYLEKEIEDRFSSLNDHFIARYKRYVSNSMGRSASSSIVVKPKLQKINFLLNEEKSDTDAHFERKRL